MCSLLYLFERQISVQSDVFIQVGARAEGSRAVRTGVGLLATVCAGVFGETGSHAETLSTNPAAERPQATVNALMVLQMGQLAEAFATCVALVERWRRMGKRTKYEVRRWQEKV